MRVLEAVENALEYIESVNGHRDGAVYKDLQEAVNLLIGGGGIRSKLPSYEVEVEAEYNAPALKRTKDRPETY